MDPIDLDEFDAALAEERLEPYPITFGGERFEIPNERLWDAEASKAIVNNDLWRLFELLLGADELVRLHTAGERSRVGRLTFAHLEHLMKAITTAQALRSPGESPAGELTPASTSAPSSPIFNATTASTSPPPSPNGRQLPAVEKLLAGLPPEARATVEEAARKAAEQVANAKPADGTKRSRAKPKAPESPPADSPG